MSILGAVVRVRPKHQAGIAARLGQLPGTDVALTAADGRLVVVIEDTTPCGVDGLPPPSAAAVLARIATWSEVLNASLVYEYSGPDAPAPTHDKDSHCGAWRNSLDTLAQGVPQPSAHDFNSHSTPQD